MSNWASVRHCGDRGLFGIWTCHFLGKLLISVYACYSLINKECLDEKAKRCAFFERVFLLQSQEYWGNNPPATIGMVDQTWRMNFQPIVILRIFWGSPGITYSKSRLEAPIYWEGHSVCALLCPRLMLNDCLLPDPPNFSLLSTRCVRKQMRRAG